MPTGVKPVIWTKLQFQANSGGTAVRKKLEPIDKLLDDWAGVKDGLSAENRYKTLMALAQACESYISRQETKKEKKERARFSKPSDRLLTRIMQTKLLCEQVFKRLAYEMHEYQKSYRDFGYVGISRQATGTRALRPGYAQERTNFEQLKAAGLQGVAGQAGVINPMGGSYVHNVHQKYVQNPLDTAQYNQLVNVAIPAPILGLAATSFDQLTGAQFQQLHQFFSTNTGTGTAQVYNPTAFSEQVHYIRKDERLSQVILIPFAGKLRNTDGTLHSSDPGRVPGGTAGPRGMRMNVARHEAWVMDEYGNILAKEIARARYVVGNVEVAQFNHSSLAAGKPVLCAGEILIHEGDVIEITNGSGHYQPTAQMLSNALQIMKEEMDLDVETTVMRPAQALGPEARQPDRAVGVVRSIRRGSIPV